MQQNSIPLLVTLHNNTVNSSIITVVRRLRYGILGLSNASRGKKGPMQSLLSRNEFFHSILSAFVRDEDRCEAPGYSVVPCRLVATGALDVPSRTHVTLNKN